MTSPFGEPAAGGRVNFGAVDGDPAALRDGTAAIDGDGRARFTATAGEAAGTFAFAARARGSVGVEFPLTVNAAPPLGGGGGDGPPGGGGSPGTSDSDGPAVTGLRRFGFHRDRTLLVLGFGEALDPGRAADSGRYALHAAGPDRRLGTHDDRPIPLRSARYDAAAGTVALAPRRRLSLRRRLLLVVDGSSPAALADLSGNRLDGDGDGRPGGDYRRAFRGRDLLPRRPRIRVGPAHGETRRTGVE